MREINRGNQLALIANFTASSLKFRGKKPELKDLGFVDIKGTTRDDTPELIKRDIIERGKKRLAKLKRKGRIK